MNRDMKSKSIYLIMAAALLILGGCKKFLEVQPQGKYTQDQVFSNEIAIQQALNGIYNNIASNNLYGANLTNTVIESLGQRWAPNQQAISLYQAYTYTKTTSEATFESIWTSAYANILQANQFIQQIDVAAKNGVISSQHATELKGEAIGLRAFMHFDLLRLFGPVMKTSPTGAAIPYYTKADAVTRPILNATQAIDSVLADLNTAKNLLSSDPIITKGPDTTSHDYYVGSRNQRFNYYAVIALQARAYLYEGDNADANATAKTALAAFDKWFPWMVYTDIVNNANPDRIFAPEMIFGVYNPNMYVNYLAYFSPTLTSTQIVTATPTMVQTVFENNTNDYRYSSTWATGTGTTAGLEIFNKYADLTDATRPWRFIQPLIRKSELYYILAETDPSLTSQLNYLNTVRNNRGLANLPTTTTNATLITEIQKEYWKEFWGEGQIFFYYKRMNFQYVPSAANDYNSSDTFYEISPIYQVPLPLSETTPR